jgi:hypothetical protein
LIPSNIQITKEKKSALLHLLDFTGEPSWNPFTKTMLCIHNWFLCCTLERT